MLTVVSSVLENLASILNYVSLDLGSEAAELDIACVAVNMLSNCAF